MENQTTNENTMLNKIMAALKEAGICKDGDSEDSVIAQIGELIRSIAWQRERKTEEAAQAARLKAAMNCEDGEFNALLDSAITRLSAANDGSALEAITAQVTAANESLTGINTQIEAANTQLSTINTQLTEARTAAANSALDLAVTSGRLAEAERDTRRGELLAIENVADFATALTTLVTAAPVLKTQSATADLGKEGKAISAANDAAEKSKQRTALVEKAKKKFPKLEGSALFDAAWNSARRENPELFA